MKLNADEFFKSLDKQDKTFEQWAREHNFVRTHKATPSPAAKRKSNLSFFRLSVSVCSVMMVLCFALALSLSTLQAGCGDLIMDPDPPGTSKRYFAAQAISQRIKLDDVYCESFLLYDSGLLKENGQAFLEFINEADEADETYYPEQSLILSYYVADLKLSLDVDELYDIGEETILDFKVNFRIRTYEDYRFTNYSLYHDLELLDNESDNDMVTIFHYERTLVIGGGIAYISFMYNENAYFLKIQSEWIDDENPPEILEFLMQNLFGEQQFNIIESHELYKEEIENAA